MPIEHGKGGTTLTGDSIEFLRLGTIARGIGLEIKGIRMTRGRSCYAIAKKELGIKGSRQKVYDQLMARVAELRAQQEHRHTNMECRRCKFSGDDVQDFVHTDTAGERKCPKCGSGECYVREIREVGGREVQ